MHVVIWRRGIKPTSIAIAETHKTSLKIRFGKIFLFALHTFSIFFFGSSLILRSLFFFSLLSLLSHCCSCYFILAQLQFSADCDCSGNSVCRFSFVYRSIPIVRRLDSHGVQCSCSQFDVSLTRLPLQMHSLALDWVSFAWAIAQQQQQQRRWQRWQQWSWILFYPYLGWYECNLLMARKECCYSRSCHNTMFHIIFSSFQSV